MSAEDYFFGDESEPDLVPRCRYCRDEELEWARVRIGDKIVWRLVDDDGEVHNCRAQAAQDDEFEDLTEND